MFAAVLLMYSARLSEFGVWIFLESYAVQVQAHAFL